VLSVTINCYRAAISSGRTCYVAPGADSRQPMCWFRLGDVKHQEGRSRRHVGCGGYILEIVGSVLLLASCLDCAPPLI
jgi:hypothetical protein